MALHLNLYHEVHKQQALQRRDPLKLAILGLVAVAVGLAGYYLLQLNSQRNIKNELASLESEYAKQAPRAAKAVEREAEITKTIKESEALVNRMEKRFYWAPVLALVAQTIPKEVQLTKLVGELGGDNSRQCTLKIEGIAGGENPRKVADDLLSSLEKQLSATFQLVNSELPSLEDSPETVKFEGKTFPSATFRINIVMQAGENSVAPAEAARTAKK